MSFLCYGSQELPHPSTLPGNVVGGQCQSSKFGTGNEQVTRFPVSLFLVSYYFYEIDTIPHKQYSTFSCLLCLPMWLQQELPHPSPAPANVAAGPSVSSKFVPENEKVTHINCPCFLIVCDCLNRKWYSTVG